MSVTLTTLQRETHYTLPTAHANIVQSEVPILLPPSMYFGVKSTIEGWCKSGVLSLLFFFLFFFFFLFPFFPLSLSLFGLYWNRHFRFQSN